LSWYHIEDTTPRARKPHLCLLCGETILEGERHVARRGIDRDGPLTMRMHTECEALTKNWDAFDWECACTIERPRKEVA
jgi:hypothetical protein